MEAPQLLAELVHDGEGSVVSAHVEEALRDGEHPHGLGPLHDQLEVDGVVRAGLPLQDLKRTDGVDLNSHVRDFDKSQVYTLTVIFETAKVLRYSF